jgi:Mn-dependent DtxR family transcriptional regulator
MKTQKITNLNFTERLEIERKIIQFLENRDFTNIKRIARRIGIDKNIVREITDRLYERGEIAKKMQQMGDVWNTSWYVEEIKYLG